MQPVHILGDNMITALGTSTEAHLQNMWQGKTGLKIHHRPDLLEVPFCGSLVENETLEHELSRLKLKNDWTRLEKMFAISIKKAAQNAAIDLSNKETLFLFSTTKGNIDLLENPQHFPKSRLRLGEMAKTISQYFGNPNQPVVVSNACISGVVAIIMASRILRNGHYKNVIVAGGDLVTKFTLSGFHCLKALSLEACKPFDTNRKGINLGEGVGTMILSLEKKSTSNIEILGGGISNDANHISGPSRTGEGLQIAINRALKYSNNDNLKSNINYISAHGTGTLYNDEMEAKAFQALDLQNVPINSMKGYWGHTLGAAGVLESIIAYQSLAHNRLFHSMGFEENGLTVPANIIEKNEEKDLNVALKTSSGFGGCNAALIFARSAEWHSAKNAKRITEYHSALRTPLTITHQSIIQNEEVFLDNNLFFENKTVENFSKFAKSLYQNLELSYPKFHKMDSMSKLGFLAFETLLKKVENFNTFDPEKIGIFIQNKNSSLKTDEAFWQTVNGENAHPSPKLFVYTLPNIVIGEICIRHKIKSEHAFFVSNDFDANLICNYVSDLMKERKLEAAVIGIVEYYKAEYFANLMWIEKGEDGQIFNETNLKKLI